jgi:hypothetical protein
MLKMLKMKNYQLVDALEFLEKSELKPRASRVRTKLNKLFYAKIQDLQGDEMALLEKYGKRDERGKLVENQGTYTLVEATAAEYHAEKRALLEETAAVNVDELKDHLSVLIEMRLLKRALLKSSLTMATRQNSTACGNIAAR